MKYPVRFFVIILAFLYINIVYAQDSIVYINMDKIMNETIAGKSIIVHLDKIHKINIEEFKKNEDELKEEEVKLNAQKNILSKSDFSNKINELRIKINNYKKSRQEKINDLKRKKNVYSSKLLEKVNPILLDYSKENKISIILPKKNVILARSDLEITSKIIEIVNSKVKKIDLN